MIEAKHTYSPVAGVTVKATTNITPYRFVNFNGAMCGDNEKALGICEISFDAEEAAGIQYIGILLIEVGTAVTQGAEVTSDAAGMCKPRGAGALNGIALRAGTVGEMIPVLLR